MLKLTPNSTFMGGVLANLATAKTRVSEIPTGTAGASLVLKYITPIDGAVGGAATLDSSYIPILGNQATAVSNVGSTYTVLEGVETFMGTISQAAKTFVDSVQTFKDSLADVQTQIGDFDTQISDIVTQAEGIYGTAGPALDGITIGVSVYFGVVIGFTFLGILGCLLMTFCGKFKCRYLIYFACVMLFIVGLIGFLLSVIFSVITPALYFGCTFIDFAVSSPVNFYTSLGGVLDLQTSNMITTCFPGQSGDLIGILAPGIAGTLDGASDSISSISDFDAASYVSQVDTPFVTMGTTLNNYY